MPDYLLKNIPEETYSKIKKIAEVERRSIRQQLLIMIERELKNGDSKKTNNLP